MHRRRGASEKDTQQGGFRQEGRLGRPIARPNTTASPYPFVTIMQ